MSDTCVLCRGDRNLGSPLSKPTRLLHDVGQRLWLDGLDRRLLRSGALQHDMAECCITGVTCEPALYGLRMGGDAYDDSIDVLDAAGLAGEELLFELAVEDVTQAADLLRPIFDATRGLDGWVSLGISPLLADHTAHTIQAAARLHKRVSKANVCIAVPGTAAGLRAIEVIVFDGVPVNVTLLHSSEHYLAAANACMSGVERRLEAGLDCRVDSVASVGVGRWDVAVKQEVSSPFHDRLGIAIAMRIYRAHCETLKSERWKRLADAGAPQQRLLWADTAPSYTSTPDTLYIQALVAHGTIEALTEDSLLAWEDHGRFNSVMPPDGGYADAVLEEFRREGVDDDALARRLQREGVDGLAHAWHETLARIRERSRGPSA